MMVVAWGKKRWHPLCHCPNRFPEGQTVTRPFADDLASTQSRPLVTYSPLRQHIWREIECKSNPNGKVLTNS